MAIRKVHKGRSLTAQETIELKEKIGRAMSLRLKGWTVGEIAKEMGLSLGSIHNYLKKGIDEYDKRNTQSCAQLVKMEEARLDKLLAAWWDRSVGYDISNRDGSVSHVPPDGKAVDVVMRVMERRAKLRGLDATQKAELTITYENMPIEQLMERALQLGVAIPAELAGKALPSPEVIDGTYTVVNNGDDTQPAAGRTGQGGRGPQDTDGQVRLSPVLEDLGD